MAASKNSGRVLWKLGVVLALLVAAAYVVIPRLQSTARVKAVQRETAVDAVTGSVSVDADGGTNKELKSEGEGKVIFCEPMFEGRRFKEGELLVELDTSDLKRQLELLKRQYEEARQRAYLQVSGGRPELLAKASELSATDLAKLFREVNLQRRQAAEKLDQARRLLAKNSIATEEFRNAERALEAIDLDLLSRAIDDKRAVLDHETALENLKIQIERMQIKAPSDGEIVEPFIWKGALIGRGHVVGKFMSHARVVAAKITEEDFGKVRIGQEARVRLLTYGDQNFDATVSKLLPKADDAQRFKAFLDVKVESLDQLRPNSTGEVTITVAKRPNAMMIPRRALFDTDKVYAVRDGRIELVKVKVGYLALNVAEILEGLTDQDRVVVDQLDQFRPGDRVQVEVAK